MSNYSFQKNPLLIFGPCALESEALAKEILEWSRQFPQIFLRAALFKPRTHPDSFQGLGPAGLPLLRNFSLAGKKAVTEILTVEQARLVWPWVRGLQIGARNMQNFELLKSLGRMYLEQLENGQEKQNVPFILLKRGFANTLEEWMASALYLERFGVPSTKIILCERGSRSSSGPHGVTLDLGIALSAKDLGPYPVIADPSHGSKCAQLVIPLARAILASGLDGLMIECHPRPHSSISDANQAISLIEAGQFLTTLVGSSQSEYLSI